jgi:hypothetical protein
MTNRIAAVAQRDVHARTTLPAPAFMACRAAALKADVEAQRRPTRPSSPRVHLARTLCIPRPPRVPCLDDIEVEVDALFAERM